MRACVLLLLPRWQWSPRQPRPPIAFVLQCKKPARWRGSSTSSGPTGSTASSTSQIDTIELASTEAGKIALKGGSADLMLSDWLWVARERSLGDGLVFYPSSSTLGAVMVPGQSPITEIADLKGKKLAVAGGPIDKSWLLLQALARRSGVDLKTAGDASSTARRRCCRRRRCRARPTPR